LNQVGNRFNSLITYNILNILDLSAIDSLCSQRSFKIFHANTIEEVNLAMRKNESILIVCDLARTQKEDLRTLVALSASMGGVVMGFYPHISGEIRNIAKNIGVDYRVPRSVFRAKLKSIMK